MQDEMAAEQAAEDHAVAQIATELEEGAVGASSSLERPDSPPAAPAARAESSA